MRICIIGLGYVGSVSAACMAALGHEVIGVDLSDHKVGLLNSGKPTVVEAKIGELTSQQVESGRLRATTRINDAINETDIAFICVGTPSNRNGSLSTHHLERVIEQIAAVVRKLERRYTVVVRSTMLPGTCARLVAPLLEQHSGKTVGSQIGLAVNPEYLREGSSVDDFWNPAKTVIGQFDDASGDTVAAIYSELPGVLHRVSIETAEMTKYVDNTFHALKVTFANEIATVSSALGVDNQRLFEIFLGDKKLNISPAYLSPGFAYGGSCLPKDLRGLTYVAKSMDIRTPLLNEISESNNAHIMRAFDLVLDQKTRRVGMLGLAFKTGTDDLRESPLVELAERLIGKGIELSILDEQVSTSNLLGANREYIQSHVPHLDRLMVSNLEALTEAVDVVVVGRAISRDEGRELHQSKCTIIDLSGRNADKLDELEANWYALS